MAKDTKKEDLNTLKETLKEIKDKKKLYNETYRNKKKQEEIKEIKETPIIKEECRINPATSDIKEVEVIKNFDWLEWLWVTTLGGFQMMGQTIIQAGMTMSIPLIIMYLKPNITTPLISTSQQDSKQEGKSIQQPITSLSSL